MNQLIMINGAMGVGKTATSMALQRMLPNSVLLDGDWCWHMRPFVVTEERKRMVIDNITCLLQNFIRCGAYQSIIFCWVMPEQQIMDTILSRLNLTGTDVKLFSLIASNEALRQRLEADIAAGVREPEVIERSLRYQGCYAAQNTEKLDVSALTAEQAAAVICGRL